jgi:hypothetical protein
MKSATNSVAGRWSISCGEPLLVDTPMVQHDPWSLANALDGIWDMIGSAAKSRAAHFPDGDTS